MPGAENPAKVCRKSRKNAPTKGKAKSDQPHLHGHVVCEHTVGDLGLFCAGGKKFGNSLKMILRKGRKEGQLVFLQFDCPYA